MADALVVYWSGTGNTEIMARKVAEGLESEGLSVDLKSVEEVSPTDVPAYSRVAFGCPSMGVEVLEEETFEPFFSEVESELGGVKVALFGSYGWGEGEWMDHWKERTEDTGADLFDTLIVNEIPTEDDEEDCVRFGRNFASF
jgi:flavodoxin I